MGMFDYIRVEVPLPDGWLPSVLQTKDFDCDMVTHVITKDGVLMLERIDETHVVPPEERPYPNEEGLLGIVGMLKCEKSLHPSDFHGIIHFYGSEYRWADDDSPASPNGVSHGPNGVKEWQTDRPLKHIWHEYRAKFTDGKLVEITVVDK